MARRAATKKAASKKARVKGPAPRAPKEVSILYERAPGFAYLPVTGALVRSESKTNTVVVTFYIDEMHPLRQVAKLKKEVGGVAEYDLSPIEEEPRRLMVAAVRMDPDLAANVAELISDRVRTDRPDL